MVFFGIEGKDTPEFTNAVRSFQDNLINKQAPSLMFKDDSFIEFSYIDEETHSSFVSVYLNPLFSQALFFNIVFVIAVLNILIKSVLLWYMLGVFLLIFFMLNDMVAIVFVRGLRKQGYKERVKVL